MRFRSTEIEIRQLQLHGIHHKSAIKLFYLQPTLLLHPCFLDLYINPGIAEIEGIGLQCHIVEGNMVEVQTGYRAFEFLVIVHPAVLPIQVLDLIQTFEQVKDSNCSTDDRLSVLVNDSSLYYIAFLLLNAEARVCSR